MRAAKTKTERRQEQIAAALGLMAGHGPKSLSVSRLAREVGVVPSAIYRHYPGKDAVLDAVFDCSSACTLAGSMTARSRRCAE